MADTAASRLQMVLDLATEHAGIVIAPDATPIPEYCTTNRVFTIGSIIAKNYRLEDSCRVEAGLLRRAQSFTFKMPKLLFSHQSEALGSWNLIARVDGKTIAHSEPDGQDRIAVVERMIAALVEFEERALDMLSMRPRRWRWRDGIGPLLATLTQKGESDACEVLLTVASACDHIAENVDAVPCFDLFPRNVIWSGAGADLEVTFIDFDKASRLIPAGEQLSHFSVLPSQGDAMEEAITRYASLSRRTVKSVKCILDLACFFRALGYVRDSLPREITGEDVSPEDPHASERSCALHKSIAEVERFIAPVSSWSGAGVGIEGDLHYLLSSLHKLEEPH